MRTKRTAIVVVFIGIVVVALIAWQMKGRVMGASRDLSGTNSNIRSGTEMPAQTAVHEAQDNPLIDTKKDVTNTASVARSTRAPQKVDQSSGKTSFQWNGPKLSPQVESALGIRKTQNQDDRWSAIHGLGKTLPPHEIDALIQFLEDKTVGGLDEDIRGEKNDILEALIEQVPQSTRIQGALLSMFRDKTHEEWWRNFCVQHFELLYRKKWSGGSAVSTDKDRITMAGAYQQALAETGNSIAGTALLGMARLSEDYPEFDKKAVSKSAVNIAGNTGADPRSRIAALQVAGRLGGSDVLPVARSVAVSGSAISLRLSAISAISEVGTAEDVSLLSQISRADEPYLAKAASNALHRIESKKASEKR